MKFKKRKKSSRFRGGQTARRGHRKRTRNLGNQGGKGMSGTSMQKKSLVIHLYGNDYFGKDKALRRGRTPKKLKAINLSQISENIDSFMKSGIAKESKGKFEINLKGYKILGDGDIGKITINASSASESAIEKVKASGGQIILPEKKPEKPDKKS